MFTWVSDLDGCALAWLLIVYCYRNLTLNLLVRGSGFAKAQSDLAGYWQYGGFSSSSYLVI